MQEKIEELAGIYREISIMSHASALMYWDQSVNMPPEGGDKRGRCLGMLSKMNHEMGIDPKIGELLDELEEKVKEMDYDSYERGLVRSCRIFYEKAAKVPPEYSQRRSNHSSVTNNHWVRARKEDDFSIVKPHLEKTLELSKEYANYFPGYDHIADPLIDVMDYGMKAQKIKEIFENLRNELVPLVKKISQSQQVDDSCLHQDFPADKQIAFGEKIIRDFGYDFTRGRQDQSPHPFTIPLDLDDVRITTRVNQNFLGEALFGSLHEAGHAMYEQGLNREWKDTPLGGMASFGIHESQSRMWENLVGRSRPFWDHYYPELKKHFPGKFDGVSLDDFYKAINKVEPGLVRTDADEVTYNLHVMIRFDLELSMLEGNLSVEELPEAWNHRYEKDLGLRPPGDAMGCMQDIHWFHSVIGGQFQCYTLGNIMASQLFEAAIKDDPAIESGIGKGEFSRLLGWLRKNVHQPSSMYTADELIEKVTGEPLNIRPYMDYLNGKYGEIYDL